MLTGKNILLGVCGGIAVYKAVDIASRLRKAGANVDVIMTKSAAKFVTPLTFQEITGNPVSCDMWEKVHTWNVKHIALAQKADLILIAPATANMVGKLANGIADDMLSTTVLASLAPVFLTPAMNTNMYNNPIFQRNLQTLRQVANYNIITPAEGHLACGTSGIGRLPEPADIVRTVENYFTPVQQDFKNVKILITAGGTREPIDPVRYIGNRSSGKMGYAIAEAAAKRGAAVTLISGVTTLTASAGIKVINVETAKEMQQHVETNFTSNDIIVMAAAVADYAVAEVSEQKIKKASEKLSLELVKNPDILLGLGQKKQQNQLLIGFAAETQNLLKYAQDKLQRKNLDMIIANDVSKVNAGFNVDTNIVKIIGKNNLVEDIPLIKKTALASIILDKINKLKTH